MQTWAMWPVPLSSWALITPLQTCPDGPFAVSPFFSSILPLWATNLGVGGGKKEEKGKPGYFRVEELLEGLERREAGSGLRVERLLIGKGPV